MNKEELELYDMVLNSKKSFDINYKELAISLREELKETKERIDKAIEYIEHEWFKREQIGIAPLDFSYEELQDLLDILKGIDNE